MAIFTRIGRLFRADVHHVLDKLEDPEIILKQAVREMDAEIEREDNRLAEVSEQEKKIKAEKDRLDVELNDALRCLDSAFGAGEEKLAKAFLKRKLLCEKRLKTLRYREEDAAAQISVMKERIASHKVKADEIREKVSLYESARRQNEAERVSAVFFRCPPEAPVVLDEELELAFIEEKNRRAQSV